MIFRTKLNKSSVNNHVPLEVTPTVQIGKEHEGIFITFWALFLTSAVGKRKQKKSNRKVTFLHTGLQQIRWNIQIKKFITETILIWESATYFGCCLFYQLRSLSHFHREIFWVLSGSIRTEPSSYIDSDKPPLIPLITSSISFPTLPLPLVSHWVWLTSVSPHTHTHTHTHTQMDTNRLTDKYFLWSKQK